MGENLGYLQVLDLPVVAKMVKVAAPTRDLRITNRNTGLRKCSNGSVLKKKEYQFWNFIFEMSRTFLDINCKNANIRIGVLQTTSSIYYSMPLQIWGWCIRMEVSCGYWGYYLSRKSCSDVSLIQLPFFKWLFFLQFFSHFHSHGYITFSIDNPI